MISFLRFADDAAAVAVAVAFAATFFFLFLCYFFLFHKIQISSLLVQCGGQLQYAFLLCICTMAKPIKFTECFAANLIYKNKNEKKMKKNSERKYLCTINLTEFT